MSTAGAPYAVWTPTSSPPPSQGPSPTFSVVVPTLARESLPRTLASISAQIQPGDEIIVACTNINDGGRTGRQRGVDAATSSHILFSDDDDVFLPGAFAVMRQFATEHPTALGIFRRQFNAGPPQWTRPVLEPGSIQIMGFVIPNVRGKIAGWPPKSRDPVKQAELEASGVRRFGQHDFILETAALQAAPVIFCDVIIGHARPEQNPLRRLRYRVKLRTRIRGVLGGGERSAPAR